MKKLFLLAVLALMAVTTFAQDGKFAVGLNIGYGAASDLKKPSIGIKASYDIIDLISIAPSFNYYFPKNLDLYEGVEAKFKMWDLNCDVHLNLLHKENVKVYPLAGITYLHRKATAKGYGEEGDASDNKVGANIGVGAQFTLGSYFIISPELKYQIASEANQFVPSVALMYKF